MLLEAFNREAKKLTDVELEKAILRMRENNETRAV